MAKTPKTTTAPTGSIAPFGLRMLPELRAKVEESAKESGRSMNAEIAARLQQSFEIEELQKELAVARHKLEQLVHADPAAKDVKLSPAIGSVVAFVADRNRQTMGEALTTLVVAGFAHGSPAVVYFAAQPSFTAGGYADVFKAVEAHLAPDTTILIESSGMRVEVRPTAEDEGAPKP